jgi:hypothetical protein
VNLFGYEAALAKITGGRWHEVIQTFHGYEPVPGPGDDPRFAPAMALRVR